MPGSMNGRELAEEVVKRRPGMKVLFTSGDTEEAIFHHGRLDPGVLLLAKPYSKAEIARELKQVILDAAENVGNEMTIADPRGPMGITGYLENIAREHPAVMCGMLARLVPIQQESTQTVDVTYHSFEDINSRLRELGLPVGRIY